MYSPFPQSIGKIGIFPLSFGRQEKLFYDNTLKRLEDWKVNYVMPEPVGGPLRYMAASDEERGGIFNSLLEDESIDFLLAMRGGFGAARALPYINWDLLLERNIPVAGFSDMTAFLIGALSRGYKNGICGVMAESTFGVKCSSKRKMTQAVNAARRCLEGCVVSVPYKNRYHALVTGKASGPVVPGNLTVMSSLIGTPWMPDMSGCILVLEGIANSAVNVDRMLCQFKSCGILGELAGIVFGQFTACPDDKYLPEIFREYSSFVRGPSFYGLRFGHVFPSAAIRVGQTATLEVDGDNHISFV